MAEPEPGALGKDLLTLVAHDPPIYIGSELLSELLGIDEVAQSMQAMLASAALDEALLRSSFPLSSGELLVMPAEYQGFVGVKVVTVAGPAVPAAFPRISGTYVLIDAHTLQPAAIIEGAALTALRTPALSLVATARLAVPEWNKLVVFGTGPQAWGHIVAMTTLRPAAEVSIVGRNPARAQALADRCRSFGITASVSGPERVADADVICTCTSAATPLFSGRLLQEHAHVNAMGSHTKDARELDDETIARAQVVVESRRAAFSEAGDLVIPLDAGLITPDHVVADLRELLTGTPVDRNRLTVFKSVGFALADLAAAVCAYTKALAAGLPSHR